jgi:hypothetical protein
MLPWPLQRRQPGCRAGRQAEGRIVAQRIRIVVVPPTLCRQQNRSADQGGEIMGDIDLAARIVQTRRHPRHYAAAFQHFAQEDLARIACQAVRPALTRNDLLKPGMTGCSVSPTRTLEAACDFFV